MRELPRLTLCIIDTVNYGKAVCSLRESLKHIKPGKALFFTDREMEVEGVETILIPRLTSKEEYSRFVIKELYKYIQTDYVLITQHDGFCLTDKWLDEFYDYDYIGAKWNYVDGRNCGNGGFSLRSQKLQTILGTDDLIDICDPEDAIIGRLYRRYLEHKYGIKFPGDNICDKFSFELNEPTQETFGFHSYFWPPYQETVMITREAALGDVVMTEPILHYFHKKGYRVVLNTLPQFQNLFVQHYFPILFPQQLNPELKVREISLDMAYEIMPTKNHLQCYYEVCGVPLEDRIMRNPELNLDFNPKLQQNKLFKKYVCIHNDIRGQEGRNIYGVEWGRVAEFLIEEGYTVVHIGMGESKPIKGAVKMNTPTEPYLMWVIGGADLFIGIDSGPANIAVALQTPAVIFTGSVDLRLIYPDLTNILWMHNHEKKRCEKPMCWHSVPGVQGVACVVNKALPPCVDFDTNEVIFRIGRFIKEQINDNN